MIKNHLLQPALGTKSLIHLLVRVKLYYSMFSCPLHLLQVEPLFLEAERKNKLLRSVACGGVEQLVELRTRWDKFEIMMESYQLMIKDQVGRGGGREEEERGGGRVVTLSWLSSIRF